MQRVNWDGLLIAVSRQPAQSKVPYVGMDDYEAGKLLGQHLAALGHRRVLVEVESLEIPSTRPRIQGLKDSLASDDIFIDTLNHPDEVTVSHIDSLVRHTHATAVAGGSDAIALRLYSALGQIGLRIPADVSLVSFDGTFAVEDFVPIPLTSVVQPIDQCVATVMEWINNDLTRDDVRRATLLTPDLRLGQSTRPITTVKSVNQG
jgi:LacI family transcriptional regulator